MKYLLIIYIILLSGCESPVKVMLPPPPVSAPPPKKICADGQIPELDGCVMQGATATIGVRGAKSN